MVTSGKSKKRKLCSLQCRRIKAMWYEEPVKAGLNTATYEHFSDLWDKYGWLEPGNSRLRKLPK